MSKFILKRGPNGIMQSLYPPNDIFDSSLKMFCNFASNKSGDQRPLKKRGLLRKAK